jgi:hypothetical protein
VTIADDMITDYLSSLLGTSSPGDTMHHLLVVAADPGRPRTPLGLVEPDALKATLYAIAQDDTVDAQQFIGKVIIGAAVDAHRAGLVIHFAGLALEAYTVWLPNDGDEAAENLARRLSADHKLEEHPSAVEMTKLYAACSDGRRWLGSHALTGPPAGKIDGPELRVGGLAHDEREWYQRMIRTLVLKGRG